MSADPHASYDEVIEINLSELEPLIALPGSPDNIKPVRDVEGTPVHQVCIGSCVNSNYRDLVLTSLMLKGRKIHRDLSLHVNPG